MSHDIAFRPATMADADLLLAWRNDPLTRRASCNTEEVTADEHRAWLARSLTAATRRLCIALHCDEPVGTIRADGDHELELSWTVAPEHRGRGMGTQMVSAFVESTPVPVYALIKDDNEASCRVARAAGMECMGVRDGLLHFQRS